MAKYKKKNNFLILIGGISSAGKTTLGDAILRTHPDFEFFDNDRERRRLLGLALGIPFPPDAFTPSMHEKLGEEIRRRAQDVLVAGKTAVVSGIFFAPELIMLYERLAQTAGVEFIGLWLEAELPVLFAHAASRTQDLNNPSSAGCDVIAQQMLQKPCAHKGWHILDANQPADKVCSDALKIIRAKLQGPIASGFTLKS